MSLILATPAGTSNHGRERQMNQNKQSKWDKSTSERGRYGIKHPEDEVFLLEGVKICPVLEEDTA